MAQAERGISNGPNSRPLDETLAETGPGIPDDSVLAGELGPGEIGGGVDAAVEKLERSGWVGSSPGEAEAEEETQAHPS